MKNTLKHSLRFTTFTALVLITSGCVTQLVTTPVQVANQSAQTAAQTTTQAAQMAIPDGDKESNSAPSAQSRAQSNARSAALNMNMTTYAPATYEVSIADGVNVNTGKNVNEEDSKDIKALTADEVSVDQVKKIQRSHP